jgi:alpha-L-fucosidase
MLKTRPTPGDTKWFVHDRFGLFIHWGLYALPARHEWIKHNEQIPDEKYQTYFNHFDPDLYDPNAWAAAAAGAGMKYFVITTKHHEGFCLWDSKLTDYKATNTPAGRDLLKPMIKAFRDRDMKVGLYHSLIDWHHPQFVIDPHLGPLRNSPDMDKLNKGRDQAKYAKYLHGQVRELLTRYGDIDILWFDFSYPKPDGKGKGRADWQSDKLYKLVRELQPKIVLNDRLDMGDKGWDIKTPEQFQPREWVKFNGQPVVWEACQTFSGSWGYHRDEQSWKSLDQLLLMLIDTVSKGGNLLLNVGPTGRGEFDARALDRLNGLGEWMRRHSRSIYGCTQAPAEFKTPQDCRLTYNPDTHRMYIHVLAWPFVEIYLEGFKGKIEYAQLLNDASEVKVEGRPAWQEEHSGDAPRDFETIRLPVQKPNVAVPVIELFLKK